MGNPDNVSDAIHRRTDNVTHTLEKVAKQLEKRMDKPTVSRIVHYVAYGTPGGEYPVGAHRAAIITEVPLPLVGPQVVGEEEPRPVPGAPHVSLCILNPTGMFFTQLVPFDETASKPGTWHWPERS